MRAYFVPSIKDEGGFQALQPTFLRWVGFKSGPERRMNPT
jgi:hypothetical protein